MIKDYFNIIIWPSIFVVSAFLLNLFIKGNIPQEDILITIVFISSFFLLGILFRKINTAIDIYLFYLVYFFTSISAVLILNLKPNLFFHQMLWIILGLWVAFIIFIFRDRVLNILNYTYILGFISLFLLVLVLLLGTDINGNKNWIILGPIQFQSSEFAKLFIIAFLSSFLAENKNVLSLPNKSFKFFYLPPFRFLAPLLTIWGLSLMMFVVLRDLGSALLFFGIVVIMTYVATSRKTYVFLASAFFLISAYFSYLIFGHVQTRVAIWLNPWSDPTGSAYQIVQSLFAISYGSILGTGYLNGFPNLIPEVHTDFIFAAFSEEFGLVGSSILIIAYLFFFYRGITIALKSVNLKYKLLAFGLSMSILLQTFIIIGGVTKILPLTGITLPFISYGGSSMLSSFISLSLILAISTKERDYE